MLNLPPVLDSGSSANACSISGPKEGTSPAGFLPFQGVLAEAAPSQTVQEGVGQTAADKASGAKTQGKDKDSKPTAGRSGDDSSSSAATDKTAQTPMPSSTFTLIAATILPLPAAAGFAEQVTGLKTGEKLSSAHAEKGSTFGGTNITGVQGDGKDHVGGVEGGGSSAFKANLGVEDPALRPAGGELVGSNSTGDGALHATRDRDVRAVLETLATQNQIAGQPTSDASNIQPGHQDQPAGAISSEVAGVQSPPGLPYRGEKSTVAKISGIQPSMAKPPSPDGKGGPIGSGQAGKIDGGRRMDAAGRAFQVKSVIGKSSAKDGSGFHAHGNDSANQNSDPAVTGRGPGSLAGKLEFLPGQQTVKLEPGSGSAGRAAQAASGSRATASTPGAADATASSSAVQSARLIQTMNQSEMRVGMHSAEFGNISIQASLTRDHMAAQISVEHGELGKALAVHMPEIEAKLDRDHGMHSTIGVHNQAQTGPGDGQQHSRQSRQQPAAEGVTGAVSLRAAGERQAEQNRRGEADSDQAEVGGRIRNQGSNGFAGSLRRTESVRLDIRI